MVRRVILLLLVLCGTASAQTTGITNTLTAPCSSQGPTDAVNNQTWCFDANTGNFYYFVNNAWQGERRINPLFLGAKFDGATDDSTANNNAEALAESLGYPVLWPSGNSYNSKPITITKSVTWQFQGTENGTTLTATTANLPVVQIQPATGGGTVSIIWQGGVRLARSVTATAGGDGLDACLTQICGEIVIDNIYTYGQYNGVHLGALLGQGQIGGVWQNSVNDGVLIDNQNYTNGNLIGWNIISRTDNSVNNNGYGYHIVSHAGYAGQTVVYLNQWSNLQTNNNTLGGIYVDGSSGVLPLHFQLSNARLSCDGAFGLRINSAAVLYGPIHGNDITSVGECATGVNEATPASGLGTGLISNASHTAITGNTIQVCAGKGMDLSGGQNVVEGNITNSNGQNGVAGTAIGINMGAGGSNALIGNVSGNDVGAPTTQQTGISLSADFQTVVGNMLGSNGSLGLSGTLTGANQFIEDNFGYNSAVRMPTVQGGATSVLTNDGSGNLSWGPTQAAWTPVDVSVAGLVFTGVSARYTKIGNLVFAFAILTFPSTADTHTVDIGGLPFPSNSTVWVNGTVFPVQAGTTFGIYGQIDGRNATDVLLYNNVSNALLTNVQLTTQTIAFLCIYST